METPPVKRLWAIRWRVALLMVVVAACGLGWARFSRTTGQGLLDALFLLSAALVVVLAVRELVMLVRDLPDR